MEEESPAYALDGTELHDSLDSIFELSQQRRRHDIMKVARFNDFREGYTRTKEDKVNIATEKEMDIQAQVLIECIGYRFSRP